MSTVCHQDQDARRKENHGHGYWSLPHTRSLSFSEKSLYTWFSLFSHSVCLHICLFGGDQFSKSHLWAYLKEHCQGCTCFSSFSTLWQNSVTLWWVGMYCLHSPCSLQSHVWHWKCVCGGEMTTLQVWKCSRKWTTDKILEFERCEKRSSVLHITSTTTTSYLLKVSTIFKKFLFSSYSWA